MEHFPVKMELQLLGICHQRTLVFEPITAGRGL
jgi:hypothetical protein